MAKERWLYADERQKLIEQWLNCSIGYAEVIWRAAHESGEVRTRPPPARGDDGLLDLDKARDKKGKLDWRKTASLTSKDDLIDYLARHHPQQLAVQTASAQNARPDHKREAHKLVRARQLAAASYPNGTDGIPTGTVHRRINEQIPDRKDHIGFQTVSAAIGRRKPKRRTS
jgi:hypothetical protein